MNYNEPEIGHDLLAILAHNDVQTIDAPREVVLRMPKV